MGVWVRVPTPAPSRNDVPIEYCGEEQSIVAVGLATPKPHVFVEAIHHLLVVCTTVEVWAWLYGACGCVVILMRGHVAEVMLTYSSSSMHVLLTYCSSSMHALLTFSHLP